jgi:ATP-binding cassette subfamily B protein
MSVRGQAKGTQTLPSEDAVAPSSSMWKQLDVLIGDRRRYVVALVFLSIVTAFTETGVIAIIAEVATGLVGSGKKGHHAASNAKANSLFHIHASIPTLLWIGLGLTVLRFMLQWPASVVPSRIAAEVQKSVRLRVFGAFARASWEVQSRDREGTLQENMTSQTVQATGAALQATGLISTVFTFLILMGSAVALSPPAAGLVFVVAVAMFAVLRPMRSLGARRSRELSQALVQYAGGVAEANRLAEESQVFGVTEGQFERISSLAGRCRHLFFRTQLIARLVPNFYQSILYVVLIIALAALYKFIGVGHAASLGTVILLLFRAAQNGQMVQGGYQSLQQSLPFVERLRAAELRYEESRPVDGERRLQEIETLAFEDLGYSYSPGRPVLSHVSFTVEAGETIGIIGPSGAGKSTLVQVLLQLRPPVEGRYLINGDPVQDYVRADWQKLVAYVPQEPRLLHASVADNIRFYRDIDDESVERAARLARIHDDITGWAQGYDTIVGPRADAVSGGQQQRICLARALAARPHVLVLDEPTSALDPYSEKLIGESLNGLRHEMTLFIVAHRMSTLDTCDRVMIILDGRMVAFDTKEYLQESDPYYRSASKIAAGVLGGVLPETL